MKLVYTYIRLPMRFLMCKQYGNSFFILQLSLSLPCIAAPILALVWVPLTSRTSYHTHKWNQ